MEKQELLNQLIAALKTQDWVAVASVSLKLNTLQEVNNLLEFEKHYNEAKENHESKKEAIPFRTNSEKTYGKLIELSSFESKVPRKSNV